jgi:TetR/AcrR family transcriptional repressor of mexCD-oprJ operon
MPEPAPQPTRLPPRHALQQRVSETILAAAARTFATGGERANLADVAVAAGVARATVYRYYPNRRRLLEELTRHAAESAHERLVAARIEEVPVEEGLTRVIGAFVDEGDAFVVLVHERGRTEGDEFERLIAAPLRRLFERARSESRSRHEVPAGVLAESLLGIVAGVLRHCSLGRDDTVAMIRAVFLEGAFGPQRSDP